MDEGSSSSVTSPSPLLMSVSPSIIGSPFWPWLREDDRGVCLAQFLLNCANLVAAGNLEQADAFLEHISVLVSPDGHPLQRIASHLAEALSRRILRSLPGVYRTLLPAAAFPLPEAVAARRHFLDLFPFLHVAFAVSNSAIMEAMEEEKMIHIIDLNASDPTQWISLLQALSNRRGGAPHLRITGVHEHRELLVHTASCLTREAERLDIPFQFNPVVSRLDNLDIESLRVKIGEALAINSVLQLHCLLATNDEARSCRNMGPPVVQNSSMAQLHDMNQATLRELLEEEFINGCTPSPDSALSPPGSLAPAPRMESFLSSLRGLSPKVMVITEQESNHNAPTMNQRFAKAFNFYAALFDCLESTMPRNSVERVRVERLFGEEMKNIVACEGLDRTERHEKMERWVQRLEMAGFSRVHLSYQATMKGRIVLRNFSCERYKLKDENGCMMICWHDRPLFSVSVWRRRR